MNILKAFAQIGPLIDNRAGVVAPVGEMSEISKTFAREKTQHTDPAYPSIALTSFSYKVDGAVRQLTDAYAKLVLKGIDWIYTQAKAGTFSDSEDAFQQAFINANGASFDLIDSGKMVASGKMWFPEYVTLAPANQSGSNNWKIWLVDSAFAGQYDEYTILVVPPVTSIDTLYDSYANVKTVVDGVRQEEVLTRANAIRGKYPETIIRPDVFTWQDRTDKSKRIDTVWLTVIYGAAGDSYDAVKEAVRNYILANTKRTKEEWAAVFPDLFTSTEFILTPLWNDIGIPNAVRETGVYSGIFRSNKALALAQKTAKGVKYTAAHVNKVWEGVPTQYKSLQMVAVGGPENRDGIDMFDKLYPDYLNVPTTHVDFMRMSENARGFVMMLSEMLIGAEEMTADSGVPTGFNRVVRDGVVYLAKSYNKFLFLVVTKYSVQALS